MTYSVIPEALRGKAVIDVATTARVLGMGVNQAYAAVRSGSIPSLRLGGRILVPVAPLLRLLGIEPTLVVDEPSAADEKVAA